MSLARGVVDLDRALYQATGPGDQPQPPIRTCPMTLGHIAATFPTFLARCDWSQGAASVMAPMPAGCPCVLYFNGAVVAVRLPDGRIVETERHLERRWSGQLRAEAG